MDVEQRARELLASALGVRVDYLLQYGDIPNMTSYAAALPALIAALTPPEGYVLVSIELLEELAAEAESGIHQTIFNPGKREKHMQNVRIARDMLAARPEVKP